MADKAHRIYPRTSPRERVYESPYHQVYKVRLDHGTLSKEVFVSDYGFRVGVIIDGPRGIRLVRQYRYLIDAISWEIPGGRVEAGESLEAAARRECLEETGILCNQLTPLLVFHPGLDTLYNPTHLFHTRTFDETERLDFIHGGEVCGQQWVPLGNCISMIASHAIVDSLSVIALLSYNTFMMPNCGE